MFDRAIQEDGKDSAWPKVLSLIPRVSMYLGRYCTSAAYIKQINIAQGVCGQMLIIHGHIYIIYMYKTGAGEICISRYKSIDLLDKTGGQFKIIKYTGNINETQCEKSHLFHTICKTKYDIYK